MTKRDLLTHVGLELVSNHGYEMSRAIEYRNALQRLPKSDIAEELRRLRSSRPGDTVENH